MVGAVLVQNGRIVAEGYHRRYGGAHAEIDLLRHCSQTGVDPRQGVLYVSLEPCCHYGKTPPCTDALIQANVQRLVVAMVDPNPIVGGQGIAKLRQAGVAVEVGLCEQQARLLNEPYIKRITTGLPWVIAKWAQTLDGRIATHTGHSRWISNDRSRKLVHRLRARVDAVLVGIGTVLADNPLLTARGVPIRRTARRVIFDPDLRIPPDAQVLQSPTAPAAPAPAPPTPPLTIAVRHDVLSGRPARLVDYEARGVEFVGLPFLAPDSPRLALEPLLRHLAQAHKATNVLVEGGSKLIGSLIQQNLVDQVYAFVCPKLLGDAQATPALQGLSPEIISDAPDLALRSAHRIGHDVVLDYRIIAQKQ